MMFNGLFVAAKVQLSRNKYNKERCKKSFLVVKVTISMCVN